jgi:hypothetical protein
MASTLEVEEMPNEVCPGCGSGFARDRAGIGYRRHLVNLPKRNPKTGEILKDEQGNEILCGGTKQSWGRGHRIGATWQHQTNYLRVVTEPPFISFATTRSQGT